MNGKGRTVILCILDGWGYNANQEGNAIALANLSHWTYLWNTYPKTLLEASGSYVGLPDGQMGNSEVGHMSIGAGRAILQDLPRINKAIEDYTLDVNSTLLSFIEKLKRSKGTCHLMGLLSPGGVHSHQDHLIALVRILNQHEIPINVHAWLDGRDTPPTSAAGYVKSFLEAITPYPHTKLVTLGGRYWAMDRDNRWDRVQKAYQAMALGIGEKFQDPIAAIEQSYAQEITDEFIPPMALEGYKGMQSQDGVLIANFRADRVREISSTFGDPKFNHFDKGIVQISNAVSMTQYSDDLAQHMQTLFPPIQVKDTLGEIISKNGGRQLRLAETEKYAHVTFFFNGGQETLFPGEDRILVPSLKVATYDLQPEMSASEITDKLVETILGNQYQLIVVNYANADMVGHSGNLQAAIKAVEVIDQCLGRVVNAITQTGGTLLITADHGNAEGMIDSKTHSPHTAHTCNLVPFVMVGNKNQSDVLRPKGRLIDIAPTILELMELPIPRVMEGKTLIEKRL